MQSAVGCRGDAERQRVRNFTERIPTSGRRDCCNGTTSKYVRSSTISLGRFGRLSVLFLFLVPAPTITPIFFTVVISYLFAVSAFAVAVCLQIKQIRFPRRPIVIICHQATTAKWRVSLALWPPIPPPMPHASMASRDHMDGDRESQKAHLAENSIRGLHKKSRTQRDIRDYVEAVLNFWPAVRGQCMMGGVA